MKAGYSPDRDARRAAFLWVHMILSNDFNVSCVQTVSINGLCLYRHAAAGSGILSFSVMLVDF